MPKNVEEALQVFGLGEPFTRELLESRNEELLATWHPPRYANLTNNPRKYMTMYRKGEAKTREIRAAYDLLRKRLDETAADAAG